VELRICDGCCGGEMISDGRPWALKLQRMEMANFIENCWRTPRPPICFG
jgi:hypothetical protein